MQGFLEFHQEVSADYTISPRTGKKVHKVKQVKEPEDVNDNGVPDSKEKDRLKMESLEEAVDKSEQRFLMLARLGLVAKEDVSKLRIAFDALKADKQLTITQRNLLLGVFGDLIGLVTGDDTIFNRVKADVQKESVELDEGQVGMDKNRAQANVQQDDPPFEKPYKKTGSSSVIDKSGAVHDPESRVRHLARLALQKYNAKKTSGKA